MIVVCVLIVDFLHRLFLAQATTKHIVFSIIFIFSFIKKAAELILMNKTHDNTGNCNAAHGQESKTRMVGFRITVEVSDGWRTKA
jgi:hypothetical protein